MMDGLDLFLGDCVVAAFLLSRVANPNMILIPTYICTGAASSHPLDLDTHFPPNQRGHTQIWREISSLEGDFG